MLRALQLNGAIGILVLMILFDNIEIVSAWVMRITVCCLFSPSPTNMNADVDHRLHVNSQGLSSSIAYMPYIISPEMLLAGHQRLLRPIRSLAVSSTCALWAFMLTRR